MFDLFRSRAKAVRILLGAMMLLVGLSMVTYLIPGGFGTNSSQDMVLAEIAKEQPVTVTAFQQQMDLARKNRSIPPGAAGIFAQQMLDQMISTEALAYQAKRMGIKVTDADLATALRNNMPQLFPNGQFVGKEVYAAFLQQQGLTVEQFESQMKRQMLIGRLTGMVNDNVVVTPEEVVRDFQRKEQKSKLQYVALAPAKFNSQVNVTPAEVQTYFDSVRAQYRTPEKRSLQMLVVDSARISQRINVSDDQLRRYYQQNLDQFRTPERVHVRHILLKTTDKPAADVPKIQAKAEDLLKQLKAGADFADLARKTSEDPGSAAKGGDLGWIVRDQTVKAFENAAFSLKPNELSGVIKTEYGFHIIQVLEKQDAHVKSFDEVKGQLAEERKKQQAYDTMQQLADQAHDELVKHPQQAADIANRLGIDLVPVSDVTSGQPVPVFGMNPDFSDTVSGLAVGGVTPVMQAPGDKLVIAVVTNVTAARPAELAEVEPQIRALLTRLKVSGAVQHAADEIVQKAKAEGGDLERVAKQMGYEIKTTQEFTPEGAADGIGSASMLQPAFDQPQGSIFGPVKVGDQMFICKIVAKIPADMAKFEVQKADIQAEIKQRKSREQVELFMDSVRTALMREGKIKVHQQVVDRVLASSRG